MKNDKWWQKAVVYQIYPRSFCDSNGDGIGDLRGIESKLPYLKELGVNTVWISPFFKSPNVDNGYDISDYVEIMDEFGTMGDFDSLIASMHSFGIKMVMDLVFNHSSDQHEWFKESRKSKDNPYRDFYLWKKGENGDAPNNWLAIFGGNVWEYDIKTDEYYFHLFTKMQPDLNWENPGLRNEIKNTCKFWLDKGVDGFRIDCANFLAKDPNFPIIPDGEDICKEQIKHFINYPKTHEYYKELYDDVFSKYDILTIGECSQTTPEIAKLYVHPDRCELNTIFQFEHVGIDEEPVVGKWTTKRFKPKDLKASLVKWQTELDGFGWNSLYLDNHDQPRLVSRFGNDTTYRIESAKMFATMLFTLRGTPYIYQGTELGMTNIELEYDEIDDCEAKNFIKRNSAEQLYNDETLLKVINMRGRDNTRTPMQWNNTSNAGFTTGKPWLKVNPNYTDINAENSIKDENGIFNYYKKLIKFKEQSDLLAYGDFTEYLSENESIFAYKREYNGEKLLVILNLTENDVIIDTPLYEDFKQSQVLFSNYEKKTIEMKMLIKSYEVIVYGSII